MASAFVCSECGAPLAHRTHVQLACTACGRGFWLLGAQLMRDDGTAVITRARRPTPQKPLRTAPRSPPPRVETAVDPSSVRGTPSNLDCPDCRTELLAPELGTLHCPGCGATFWMRGGEVIRAGENDPVALPSRTLPTATLRVRPKPGDDDES